MSSSSAPADVPKANGVVGRAAVELRKRGILKGTGLRVVRAPRFPFGPLTLRLGLLGSPLHVLPAPQRRLEELLADRAVRLGAAVLRGHDVTAFEQDDDGVTVRAVVDGGEVDVRARYLAGCDGAHSLVRARLGVGFPGVTSPDLARIARITIPSDAVTRGRECIDIRGVGPLVPFRPHRTGRGSVTISAHRGYGVTHVLVRAAVDLARQHDALAVEGWPLVASTPRSGDAFVGREEVFRAAGFGCVDRPTPQRAVMRLDLRAG